jgi:hypothetical protein
MSSETFTNTNSPTSAEVERNIRENQAEKTFSLGEVGRQQGADNLISARSNLGSAIPLTVPTARTLFYRGGFYQDGQDKYGQFLFYSLRNPSGNNFTDLYYKSERTDFNTGISSFKSKNPSAGSLVKYSNEAIEAAEGGGSSESASFQTSQILGGASAPYTWGDFLYCKYYGTIPNNYMITLRRFPSPMRDNLSLPDGVIQSDYFKFQGAGRPVAQAVTWWGGATDNSLSDIVGFSTGLVWQSKTQADLLKQEGFDQGFFKSVLGRAFTGLSEQAGAGELLALLGNTANIAVQASQTGLEEVTIPKINFALRDKMTQPGGPLSDFIFVSVDTVDKTYIRGRGLTFNIDKAIDIKFHYELTSVGEVNTKAAMFDIIANLLALGTNYGNFLTPEIRYDNKFPAIGFPGGDDGLKRFFTDPIGWTKTAIQFLADPSGTTMNNPVSQDLKETQDSIERAVQDLASVIEQFQKGDLKAIAADAEGAASNVLAAALADDLIQDIRLPLSLYTGAPVGEWHLVVGNPLNPVAMIGNLICDSVSIEFGEVLGPDDFPTELVATFSLKHGRDRDKGEIESIFNRGQQRLYQSSLPTYSSNQSTSALANTDGSSAAVNPDDSTQTSPLENLQQQTSVIVQ